MNHSNLSPPVEVYDIPLALANIKIILLIATGVAVHFSLTPPNVAKPKTVITKASLFERAILWITFCSKTLVWIMTISDAITTYVQAYHAPTTITVPSSAVFASNSDNRLLNASPMMVLGTACVVFGSLLRQWCFRQLGPMFTFEITIQSEHRLVTTGPYSIVRHPSYTGVYCTLIGSTLVGFAPGSYLRECWLLGLKEAVTSGVVWQKDMGLMEILIAGIVQVAIFALVVLWFVSAIYALKSTIRRPQIEDHELHRVFGKQWEKWADRVRWKMVPGIF